MTDEIEKWLNENEVTKCPSKSAAGADNLRFAGSRSHHLRYVVGEKRTPVSTITEMRKRNARIKLKAEKARKAAARKITNTAMREKKRRRRQDREEWAEPSLAVLMGERMA